MCHCTSICPVSICIWLWVKVSGKLLIPCCLSPPSWDRYLLEQQTWIVMIYNRAENALGYEYSTIMACLFFMFVFMWLWHNIIAKNNTHICIKNKFWNKMIMYFFKLGEKYYTPQVRHTGGSNSWPPDHNSTYISCHWDTYSYHSAISDTWTHRQINKRTHFDERHRCSHFSDVSKTISIM